MEIRLPFYHCVLRSQLKHIATLSLDANTLYQCQNKLLLRNVRTMEDATQRLNCGLFAHKCGVPLLSLFSAMS